MFCMQKEMKSWSIGANGNECWITVEAPRLPEQTPPIRPIRFQWWYAPTFVLTPTIWFNYFPKAEYIFLSLISNGPCTWWITAAWMSKFQGRLNTKKLEEPRRRTCVCGVCLFFFFFFFHLSWSSAADHAVSRTHACKLAIMNSSSVMMNRTRRCSSCFQDAKCLIAKLHRSSLSNLSSCALFLRRLFVKECFHFIVRNASLCVIQSPCMYTRLCKRS